MITITISINSVEVQRCDEFLQISDLNMIFVKLPITYIYIFFPTCVYMPATHAY